MRHTVNLTGSQSRKLCIFILSGFAVAGIITGAVFACLHGVSSPWLHQYFSPVYSGDKPFDIFRNDMISSAVFIVAAFFIGLFAFGQPVGAAMLIYRGFGIGGSAAMMYSLYGNDAAAPVLVLITPKAVAVIILSVLAVRELIRSSGAIFSGIISENSHDEKRMNFKLYCIKFSVLLLLSLIVAAADTALNYISAGFLQDPA